jgi:hypothetical protein
MSYLEGAERRILLLHVTIAGRRLSSSGCGGSRMIATNDDGTRLVFMRGHDVDKKSVILRVAVAVVGSTKMLYPCYRHALGNGSILSVVASVCPWVSV